MLTWVSWENDMSLSDALIAVISKNSFIKQGLFPSPGANALTAKGGGKAKTKFHWLLCKALFSEHPMYGKTFAQVKESISNLGKKQATAH